MGTPGTDGTDGIDGMDGAPGDPVDNVTSIPGTGNDIQLMFFVDGMQVGNNVTVPGGTDGEDGNTGPQGDTFIPVYFNPLGDQLTWDATLTLRPNNTPDPNNPGQFLIDLTFFSYVPLSENQIFTDPTADDLGFRADTFRNFENNDRFGRHEVGAEGPPGDIGPAGAAVAMVGVTRSANQTNIPTADFPDGGTRYDVTVTLNDTPPTVLPVSSFIAATAVSYTHLTLPTICSV